MPDIDTDIRTLLESLSDETIHGVIDALVRGLIQSIADEIIEHAVAAIISHLEAASGPPDDEPTPEPTPTPPAPKLELATSPPPASHKKQDSEERTCELCGRVGFRRFVETASGWKCAPTAKCGDRPAQTAAQHPPVPAPPPAPQVTGITPGVTARCQDCTRTFTLTGVVLETAIRRHELQHGHVVTILGEAV